MRFDSTLYYHVGEDYSWPALFDEMHETVGLLDELGYTGMWLAEHHFAWDGWYRSGSNPILFGADVARFSDRLRVGQCGVILPDWHPLRLAEDIAFLDQATKGRVDFGIAPGINSRACMNFHEAGDRRDRDRNKRLFEEALDVVLAALYQETFSHKGEFFEFPAPGWIDNEMVHDPKYHAEDGEMVKMAIAPRPYQKRLPIYQMAESKGSTTQCARRGIGTMSQGLSPGRSLENWKLYQQVATETHGRAYELGEGMAMMRPVYVAETQEQAEKDCKDGYNLLGQWGSHGLYKDWAPMVTEEELESGDEDLTFFDFQIKHGMLLIGSPENVAAQIKRLNTEVGCEHLALFLNIPMLSYEQVTRSLTLFAQEVMPQFMSAEERAKVRLSA